MSETSEIPIGLDLEQKPQTLWRAFTVDPRELSQETLSRPLVPGTTAADDPTRIGDGNELGVYMSTNRSMVETAYAHGKRNLSTPAPKFNDDGSVTKGVTLPECGVVVRVDTNNLPIRKPQIIPALRGHYNNGFEGDEYIADKVPPEKYQVARLVLSRWANDNEKFVVDVENGDSQHIQNAIDQIQAEFKLREEKSREFVDFLMTLDPKSRMSGFQVKRLWQQHLENK